MTVSADRHQATVLPPPRLRQSIRKNVFRWFGHHKRDLPWRRRSGEGYAQWIAEVMLQQTQVETVIPYYERFMKRFPNVEALAAASDDEVLQNWQGLGYYRRAVNLHRAAKRLVAAGATVPGTVEELLALPGIGPYTAGAIASIAFNRRAAAVDGNIARILSRLFSITDDITRPESRRRLWTLARCLLPATRCGDFNQALMDLGATVCLPRKPRCHACPLQHDCEARRAGDPMSLPRKAKRRPVPEIRHVVAVVKRDNAYLMVKRPPGGLWSGLWEFPNEQYSAKRKKPGTLRRLINRFALDASPQAQAKGTLSRRLTHRLMHFDTYLVSIPPGHGPASKGRHLRWVTEAGLGTLPMSAAFRKILALANNTVQQ